jgi:hypothetical protein
VAAHRELAKARPDTFLPALAGSLDIDSIEPIRVSAQFDPTSTFVEFEAGAPGSSSIGGEMQDRSRPTSDSGSRSCSSASLLI